MNPGFRPTRSIHIEAGIVISAVPSSTAEFGSVANCGTGAIWDPARAPTVATITAEV